MQKILFTTVITIMHVALSGCVVCDPYSDYWHPTPHNGWEGYTVTHYAE